MLKTRLTSPDPRRRSTSRTLIPGALTALLIAVWGCSPSPPEEVATEAAASTTLIVGATVIDGTGAPGVVADVRIEADRIAAVGDLEPRPGEPVIEGTGLVLAPGFIDTHSHGDSDILERPDAVAAVSQGITTIVGGADGGSKLPLAEFFDQLAATPPAVNVASWGGHNTYRDQVMGDDFRRPATEDEIAQMRQLLAEDLRAGALGVSTGLEYDPGIYSETEEVMALARDVSAQGGRYTSHLRSEDRYFWEAVDEILAIGREAQIPVNITHIKLAMQSSKGQAERLLTQLDEARAAGIEVTADIYPYTYWQSTLEVLFPERDFDNLEAARFAITEVSTPEGLLITEFAAEPELADKTLAEIAALRDAEPAVTLMALIREAQEYKTETGETEAESVIGVSMAEEDIERIMQWPHTNICTDGELWGSHPRGFGTFPRVLGRYVRDLEVISLEDAIHKMTGLATAAIGFGDRGLIQPGMFADLVLFDLATIHDRATTDDPHALSEGILKVWVNGRLVWDHPEPTQERPGRVLRRQ